MDTWWWKNKRELPSVSCSRLWMNLDEIYVGTSKCRGGANQILVAWSLYFRLRKLLTFNFFSFFLIKSPPLSYYYGLYFFLWQNPLETIFFLFYFLKSVVDKEKFVAIFLLDGACGVTKSENGQIHFCSRVRTARNGQERDKN